MNKLATVTLTGSPHERGYQHGKTLKEGIHSFYEKWMKFLVNGSAFKITQTDLFNFARKNGPFIKQYAPDICEEMKGIAEGAEVDFDKMLFINCFDEITKLIITIDYIIPDIICYIFCSIDKIS